MVLHMNLWVTGVLWFSNGRYGFVEQGKRRPKKEFHVAG